MTEELFTKVARLLNHYIELLDEHSIGDTQIICETHRR